MAAARCAIRVISLSLSSLLPFSLSPFLFSLSVFSFVLRSLEESRECRCLGHRARETLHTAFQPCLRTASQLVASGISFATDAALQILCMVTLRGERAAQRAN